MGIDYSTGIGIDYSTGIGIDYSIGIGIDGMYSYGDKRKVLYIRHRCGDRGMVQL